MPRCGAPHPSRPVEVCSLTSGKHVDHETADGECWTDTERESQIKAQGLGRVKPGRGQNANALRGLKDTVQPEHFTPEVIPVKPMPIPIYGNVLTMPPRVRASDPMTSHAAAHALADDNAQAIMHNLLVEFGRPGNADGLTADEVTLEAGYPKGQGVWKRVSDLKSQGLIEPTGTKRPGISGRDQEAHRITEAGRAELAAGG